MWSQSTPFPGSIEFQPTASNGSIALAKIPQVNPDVITLGIELPAVVGVLVIAALSIALYRVATRSG